MMLHTAVITTTVIGPDVLTYYAISRSIVQMPDRVTSTPGTTQPGMIPGEAAGLPGGSQKKMLATVRS